MALYRDPILDLLKTVLNDEGPAALKGRYYVGDPLIIGKAKMPAVFITRDKTRVNNDDVQDDMHIMPVVLNVVQDLTKDFNQAFDNLSSANTLYEWVEARNADMTLRSDSLLYVLRAHQEFANNLWINQAGGVEANYGVGIQKRGQGIYSVEAVIKLEIDLLQAQPPAGTTYTQTSGGGSGGSGSGGAVLMARQQPVEPPDGSRTTFTVPNSYQSGSLSVFVNGLYESDVTENSATTFTLGFAPISTDVIMLVFAH